MTRRTLRQIARKSGLAHAEYCLIEAAHTMRPNDAARLFAELDRLTTIMANDNRYGMDEATKVTGTAIMPPNGSKYRVSGT